MAEQDKKNSDNVCEGAAERELAEYIKENRYKSALYHFISVATKSYVDGMNAAIRCQKAAQATAQAL